MAALLLVILTGVPRAAPDTAVVCPAEFRQALRPWWDHRLRQGHVLAMLSSAGSPAEIKRRIAEVAGGGRLRFIVLVGDAEPGLDHDSRLRARCVPTHYARAEVTVLWGSEPLIATDNWYADLDGDGIPEVAVGRLPADTPPQLRQIVANVLRYEQSADFGPWRRRLSFVAGVGGFGRLADSVIESTARFFLTQGIPAEYRVVMTYANWRSPFCPDPRLFHQTALQRFNEGAWFWVYIGHGFHLGLDRVRVPGREYHILDVRDVSKLKCLHGAPIALFMACYTGAFDAQVDCLAEQMLRQPEGPVAVIAGSRVTMPYAMTVLATELTEQCLRHRRATLGEALLQAKREMAQRPEPGDQWRAAVDAIAGLISPAPEKLAVERAEHLLLFNLIGDPLLRLRYPRRLDLQVRRTAVAGEELRVSGACPLSGRGRLELVVRRDRLAFRPTGRPEYPPTSEMLSRLQQTYDRANDRRLAEVELDVVDGRFAATIRVPRHARGKCHVRAFVEGPDDFAVGAADVEVLTAAEEELLSARSNRAPPVGGRPGGDGPRGGY